MKSPKQSTLEIRQDHGFNSSVVAGINNALGSKFTINQVTEIFKQPILKLGRLTIYPTSTRQDYCYIANNITFI